ncbi:MAG TPA: M12 family metallo-peptidase [Nevskiaceae bacterium]|nr:M12 family metallo-peptidase [Nevskiaceae bacterium]
MDAASFTPAGCRAPRWLPLLALLVTVPAHALSYRMPPDAALVDGAPTVVLGHIESAAADPQRPNSATLYQLDVDRLLKGLAAAAILRVRVPGAYDATQPGSLVVPGAPVFMPGERLLLMLQPRGDGSYAISQLALGAFHVRSIDGIDVLLRQPDQAAPQQWRRLDAFGSWISSRAGGLLAAADYWVQLTGNVPALKYALEGSPPVRWFDFDQGRSVTFYSSEQGQIGLLDGGVAEFRRAIAAWNADTGSNINYVYGGLSSASGGMDHADGVNEILFNDPNGELSGVFDCTNGGVIAYGGYWTSGNKSTHRDGTFQMISEADIVVQNGAGCILSALSNSNADEVFAHELGHTLGLAHPCGESGVPACTPGSAVDDAIMRPYVHADSRGASLRSDDQQAIAYDYSSGSSPPPPAAVGRGDPEAGIPNSSDSSSSGGGGALDATLLLALALALWRRAIRRFWWSPQRYFACY